MSFDNNLININSSPEFNSREGNQVVSKANDVCELCNGTGVEVIRGKGARPCSCRGGSAHDRLLKAARIPLRYHHCTIGQFKHQDADDNSKFIALGKAEEFIKYYHGGGREKGLGLLFSGPVGVGKTHLAVAILLELIRLYRVSGLFYEFGALLKEIQASYNPISQTSEMRVLAPVYEAEVLVLDELGASIPTDWVRDTMYQIINKRYNDQRVTIFTTNFPDKIVNDQKGIDDPTGSWGFTDKDIASGSHERPKGLSDRRPSAVTSYTLEDRIGTRLRSRLYEMCSTIEMQGSDYRLQIQPHNSF